MRLYKKMRPVISLVVIITFCSNLSFSNYVFASGTMLKPNPAVKHSEVLKDIGNQDGGLRELIDTAEKLNLNPQTFSDFRETEKQIAGPLLDPLQKFVEKINSGSSLYKIGFTYKDNPKARAGQIGFLLAEINKELAKPGTGNLPKIAVISDYHGGADRLAALLSDALADLAGFKGRLDPKVSIEKQLQAQGLSLKTMEGAIYLNGDLLDRGKEGLKCFQMVKELIETAPEKVLYNSGNHDLWAFLNLMGFHLPWYKGFNLYGDEKAEEYIRVYRIRYSRYFDSPQGLLWWTERLAEFNDMQTEFQKTFFGSEEAAKNIRGKFVHDYATYSKKWNKEQIKAWEFFAGHFASLDVPDPEVGLNGIGKTSARWWNDLHQQLMKGLEARSNTGADEEELAAWKEAIALSEKIFKAVDARDEEARYKISEKWWYLVLEAINNKAYDSVEWWGKDWSSHKGWGEEVIKELNAMIKDEKNNNPLIVQDREEFKGEKVTQANYMRSHTLQDLAAFYKNNFNIGLKTPYGDMITHGLLPIVNDDVVISYKSKTYRGKEIFEVLKLVAKDIKEEKDLKSIWEALSLVNSWYSDATTIAKPKHVKELLNKIAPVLSNLGVRIWAMGHNPVNKVKAPVISRDAKDSRFGVVQLDLGMAPKFGGTGGYVVFGANGIVVRGFETDKTDEAIKESPDTIIPAKKEGDKPTVIKNPGMPAKEYLENTKAGLEEELARLQPPKTAASLAAEQAKEQFLKDIAGIIEVTSDGVKVLDRQLFLEKGVDILANAAALSKNPDVKIAAKRITLELLPQFGVKAASDHEFYMAKQQGKWKNITVPAVNGRSTVYLSFRPLFRVAKEDNVGVVKTEVARSEMRYSAQDSAEIVAISGLAAIKEGWTGLLFVQQDHNQMDKEKYLKGGADRQKEIDARNTLFREGILAGQYNIDLDPSTLVDEAALAEIIKTEGELVDQYLQKHPDLLTAIGDDSKAQGSLRRRLVDEIEIGDVEDKDFLVQPDIAAKITLLKEELYPKMHRLSIEATLNDIRTIRKIEKELGLTKSVSIGIEERHIDNKVHKDFPSTVLGSITLSQSILKVAKAENLVAHSKISLQTGAMHGVGGTVDFGIYERHVKHADKIGVSVFVQHGASTLEKQDFDKMRDGDVGEVHLATEYQKIVFSIIAQDYPELAEKMAKWLEEKMATDKKSADKFKALWDTAFAQQGKDRKTIIAEILGDSSNMPKELKGKFKDLVKELSAPFKNELWNLPENVNQKIDKALYDEFKLIFGKLGVIDTKELIETIMPYNAYPVQLVPRMASVDTVFAKTVTLSPEQQAKEQFLKDIAGIIEVTSDGVKVLDRQLFLEKGVDILANAAALSKNPDVKIAAKRITLELLPQFGVKAASDHEFYMAKQQGKWKNITVPAVNGRSTVYLSFRPLFRVAKEDNVGVVKTEVARSEMRYSAQDSAEIVAISGLAAIKEGWTGLLFVQQDHNQMDKEKYLKGGADRQKEIDARNTLFREGILAGQYNIDLDPSTLVDEAALAEIIKTEGELVDQYLQKHPDLLTAIGDDSKAQGSLRRRLVDEIEIGDVEDKDFLVQPDIAAKITLLKEELYPKMHRLSIEATLNDIRTIRKIEKELGLTKSVSIGIEERHIDNKVHKDFPSTVLGSITLSQSILKVAKAENLVAHSKISLQTGAMHGVGGTVDFGIYERHVKHADKIGVSVFVQHGASTLEKQDFDKMRDGDVGEVHLATEYQKIVFSIIAQDYPELAEKMAKWLEEKMATDKKSADKFKALWDTAFAQQGKDRKTIIAEILGDSSNMPKELKGKFKDLVKELSAPFKNELWNLPENVNQKIDKALYDEFKLIFGKLGVIDTKELIETIMPYNAYPVQLVPRMASVDTVFAKEPVFNSALIVDPGLLSAGGVTEILKVITKLQNQAVVFYGPGAQAMKVLSGESANIFTADSEVKAVAQLTKEKGVAPENINLITSVFKDELKATGVKQKIVSASDTMSVMFGLTKAEAEINQVPAARTAFNNLYNEAEKAGAVPLNAAEKAQILAQAIEVVETVEIKSAVKITEKQKDIIEEVATKIGV